VFSGYKKSKQLYACEHVKKGGRDWIWFMCSMIIEVNCWQNDILMFY